MKKNSWSEEKTEQARIKQERKTAAIRAEARRDRLGDFTERLGSGSSGLDLDGATEVLRAIVEGDVRTTSPRVDEIKAETSALHDEEVALKTELGKNHARFRRGLAERERHLDTVGTWNDNGRRTKVPTTGGSKFVVAAMVVTLVVIEAVLLTSPAEAVVRLLFPSAQDVTVPALVAVIALVALGAAAVLSAAQAAKEYVAETAQARTAGIASTEGPTLLEPPSALPVRIWCVLASFIQLILMALRLQVDTGDSSARGVLVLVSVLVAGFAVVIGLLEYRRHEPSTHLAPSWDNEAIDRQSAMHAELNRVQRRMAGLQTELTEMHRDEAALYQALSGQIENPTVLQAINKLVNACNAAIADSKKSSPDFKPLDLTTPGVTGTDLPEPRAASNGHKKAAEYNGLIG